MLRSLLRTLRQPRYAALTGLMIVVAAVCVGAGTWQVSRLAGKVAHNDELRRNAHAPAAAITDVLPLVGTGSSPATYDVEFRRVTATGSYDADHQWLVRQRSVNDATGWLVLTPLRTSGGVLLVVRGFIPASAAAPAIPAPPTGQVHIVGRIHPAETSRDHAGSLPGRQIESINPAEQATRLGTALFAGYAALEPAQPGVGTLVAIPEPDLSNPAGGAVEPQHVAYVIQWYLFALLALAAPIAMARAETRHQISGEFDEPPATVPTADEATAPTPEQARAAKLADRYGRPVR